MKKRIVLVILLGLLSLNITIFASSEDDPMPRSVVFDVSINENDVNVGN